MDQHWYDYIRESRSIRIATKNCLAEALARATNDVADDVTTPLAAFEAEEATNQPEEAVLSCSSSAKAVGFSILAILLLLAVGGWPRGTHLHGGPGLLSLGGCVLVDHVEGG